LVILLACAGQRTRSQEIIWTDTRLAKARLEVAGGKALIEITDPGQELNAPRALVRFYDEKGISRDTFLYLTMTGEGLYRDRIRLPGTTGLLRVVIEDTVGHRLDGEGRGIFRYAGKPHPWLMAMVISERHELTASEAREVAELARQEIAARGNPMAYYYFWERDTALYGWEDVSSTIDSLLRETGPDGLYLAYKAAELFGQDSLQAIYAENFARSFPKDPRVNEVLFYLAKESDNLEVFLREHPEDSVWGRMACVAMMSRVDPKKSPGYAALYAEHCKRMTRFEHTSPEPWIRLAGIALADPETEALWGTYIASAEARFSRDTMFLLFGFVEPETREKIEMMWRQDFWNAKANYLVYLKKYNEAIALLEAGMDSLGESGYLTVNALCLSSLLNAQIFVGDTPAALLTATWLKYRGDFPDGWIEKVLSWTDQETRDSLMVVVRSSLPPAEDFVARTLGGDTIKLSALRGKVVVLNFWATWCGPCRQEIPVLNELVKEYESDTGVLFLALTQEDSATLSGFLGENPFLYTQMVEAGPAFKAYGILAVPTHFVISPEGTVVLKKIGSLWKGSGELRERIDAVRR